MRKSNKTLIAIICIVALFQSCKKCAEMPETINQTTSTIDYKKTAGVAIELGEKKKNAYSIESFMNAYLSLKKKEAQQRKSENNWSSFLPDQQTMTQILVPNTKYLRVLPRNEDEYDALRDQNPTRVFYDFPIEYEITVQGNYYHDPSLPDTQITWQYVVLRNDENISISFQKQTVETDIFLPENSPVYSNYTEQFWTDLETEALALNGYSTTMRLAQGTNPNTTDRYRPNGRILVRDYVTNTDVPLVGAKIICHASWRSSCGYTDANGNFSGNNTFITKCDYNIKWESDNKTNKFDVRSGWYGQAWSFIQSNSYNACFVTLHTGWNKSLLYANIFRATYDFFNNDPFNLYKGLMPRMKIAGYTGEGTGVTHFIARIVGGPHIRVWDNNEVGNTLRTYGTTIHELGHAQQRSFGPTKFVTASGLIRESWGDCVEWAFCNWKYNNTNLYTTDASLFRWYRTNNFLNINTSNNEGTIYTCLFIDLVDNINNNSVLRNNNILIRNLNDNVGGYTLNQIQWALYYKGWLAQPNNILDDIRDYLVSTYTNPTENNINAYFNDFKNHDYPNR